MGLDMYLRLKEHSKCSVKGFGGDGDTMHRDPNDWVCVTKEYAVADWRKANHIHPVSYTHQTLPTTPYV